MAIISAAEIKTNAFQPKKAINIIVIAKLAHGLANKNVITAAVDAPFLYSSMDIASTPCEQTDKMKPKIAALIIVFLPGLAK